MLGQEFGFDLVPVTVFSGAGDDWDDRSEKCLKPLNKSAAAMLICYIEAKAPRTQTMIRKDDRSHLPSDTRSVQFREEDGFAVVTYSWKPAKGGTANDWLTADRASVSYVVALVNRNGSEQFEPQLKVFMKPIRARGVENAYGQTPQNNPNKFVFGDVFHGADWWYETASSTANTGV